MELSKNSEQIMFYKSNHANECYGGKIIFYNFILILWSSTT